MKSQAALSGLNVSQKQLERISKNLAGSLTPGYMAIEAQEYSMVQNGVSAGVQMGPTYRVLPVEAFLITSNRGFTQQNSLHQVINHTLGQINNFLSRNDENRNMGSLLQNIINAYGELSNSSALPQTQDTVIRCIDSFNTFLASASANNLGLRQEAENNISQSVSVINQQLEKIHSINLQILANNSSDTSTLESQRDLEMKILSEHVDFTATRQPLGELYLYSTRGDPLLESSTSTLSFEITSGLNYGSTYPMTANGLILIDQSGNSRDITQNFSAGSVVGNFIMRDKEIPNIQSELDQLALQFKTMINEINNLGTPFPPPSTLDGSRSFTPQLGATPFQGQGIFRTALMGPNNALIGYYDLDLSTVNTIGDLVAALQTNLSIIDNNVTVTLAGDDNHLQINTTTVGNIFGFTSGGVAAIESTTGYNLSHYLGFNDLITSRDEQTPGLAASLAVKNKKYLTHSQLAQTPAPQVGDSMLQENDGSIAIKMVEAFAKNITFPTIGNLGNRQQTLVAYSASIVTELATRTALEQNKANSLMQQLNESDIELADVGGVSTTEAMQEMLEQTNRYRACTKALEAYQKMMDALLSI